MVTKLLFALLAAVLVIAPVEGRSPLRTGFVQAKKAVTPQTPYSEYTLLKTFVRKADLAYTQGLSFLPEKNILLESSGYWGETAMRYISLDQGTSTVQTETKWNKFTGSDFGEGSSLVTINGKPKALLLTWTQRDVFVFNPELTVKEDTFFLNPKVSEGWGMTNMQEKAGSPANMVLISDGTDMLYECDADKKLEVVKTHKITDINGQPLRQMNELEYVGNGLVWANIYLQNDIVLIDLKQNKVVKKLDLSNLQMQATRLKFQLFKQYLSYDEVLNGIAYNPNTDTLYVTGKRWPAVFEIRVGN